MPAPVDPFDRYRVQYERISRAFRDSRLGETIELECDDLSQPTIAYQRDHIIVKTEPDNLPLLGARYNAVVIREASSGTKLMKIDTNARDVIRDARQQPNDWTVSLNHLIAVAAGGDVNLCPADEPMPPGATVYPDPAKADKDAGAGVRVDVLDTGMVRDFDRHPWINVSAPEFRLPLAAGDDVPLDYGHGTFVAGVLCAVAPAAQVHAYSVLSRAGATTEFLLLEALEAALSRDRRPDIISLSAGGTSSDLEMMNGLTDVVCRLDAAGIVLVAAAGNNGNTTNFFPAAFSGRFPNVVSVGAARQDLQGRACFSNHGDWVTIYAPGERLVNAFATGSYSTKHKKRDTCRFLGPQDIGWVPGCTCVDTLRFGEETDFDGLARWSGTSFATPIVSGLIAGRLAEMRKCDSGATAAQAALWLRRHAKGRVLDERLDATRPLVLPSQPLTSRCGTDPDCEGDCERER